MYISRNNVDKTKDKKWINWEEKKGKKKKKI